MVRYNLPFRFQAPGLMTRLHLDDLWLRATSALVLVAAAVATLILGGPFFVVFWLGGALCVHWEWQRLLSAPLPWFRLFGGGLALCAAAALFQLRQAELAFLLLPLAAAFCGWAAGQGFRLWAASGVFYAGGLLLAVLTLRHAPFFGSCAIGWLFAVVWGTDVCAYFGGRLIGGPKLAPAISPGKTWSGFWVGVVCGAGLGALAAHFWPNVDAPFWPLFLLGLVAGALAQGGDLFESWIKRRFNVKDSSGLIPGHGGFMDRLDGFIAAAIFAALFGLSRGLPSAAAGLFFWP
jgi:phosphatidate cytidylyltransferase